MNVKGYKRHSAKGRKQRARTEKNNSVIPELEELKKNSLLRKPACIESSHNSKVSINERIFINFSSNDFSSILLCDFLCCNTSNL